MERDIFIAVTYNQQDGVKCVNIFHTIILLDDMYCQVQDAPGC